MSRYSSTTRWSRKARKQKMYYDESCRWYKFSPEHGRVRKYLVQNFGKTIRKIRKEKIKNRKEYAFFLWSHLLIDRDFDNTSTLKDQICKLLNIGDKMTWPFDMLNPDGVRCLGTWEVLDVTIGI